MLALIFVVVTALLALIYNFLLNRPDLSTPLLRQYLLFFMILSASVVLVRLVSYLIIDVLFTRLSGKTPSDLLRLVIAILVFGIALILNMYYVLDANIAALLTTSALLTAVIGFALQATLGNLFEGLSVQVHQPFTIGDWLEFGDNFGRVESLTWRAIAVRRTDNTILSVPNNILAQSPIRVFSASEPFRLSVDFSAPIDTPPHQVIEAVSKATAEIKEVLHHKPPEILLEHFAADQSALHYKLRFYTMIDESFDRTQARVRERIWYALARAGIPAPASIEGSVDSFKVPLLRSHQATLLPETDLISLFAATPILTGLSDRIYHLLAEQAIRLIYSPGEHINQRAQPAMFIVRRGIVSVPLEAETRLEDYHNGNLQSYWEPEILDEVRHQFAEYVGPVADYLVKTASQETIDPYHLYRILAADIPNELEREAFIQLGPKFPAKEIADGHFFGEVSLLTGQFSSNPSPKAVIESELVEITVPMMRQAFVIEPNLAELLARRVVSHRRMSEADQASFIKEVRAFYKVG